MRDQKESQHLADIAQRSMYGAGLNKSTIKYSFKIFSRFLRGKNILELGPAEGIMTDHLVSLDLPLTVVEGAELFCKDLKKRHPQIEVVHSLFENYEPSCRFDNIVMGHVLEHVLDPVDIIGRAAGWLTPRGRILAVVPNSRSLHRQAAVAMGLLSVEDELNDQDRYHGHRRVFNPESLRNTFFKAGLKVDAFGGYWIKPFANNQLELICNDEMLEAFMTLGERYPDIAAEIYAIGCL